MSASATSAMMTTPASFPMRDHALQLLYDVEKAINQKDLSALADRADNSLTGMTTAPLWVITRTTERWRIIASNTL